MFSIQNYTGFILAVIIFQIIPGPGTVTILNSTARKGFASGMSSVFGTLSGDFLYMSSAVLGLTGFLDVYPFLLGGARWFGILYLCLTGFKLLRGSKKAAKEDPVQSYKHSFYLQGLAVSLSNPKVMIFFLAFFPLFLSESSGTGTLLILMIHVTVISFFYQTGIVLIGNATAKQLSECRNSRIIASRLAGITLIGFGAKLAFFY